MFDKFISTTQISGFEVFGGWGVDEAHNAWVFALLLK